MNYDSVFEVFKAKSLESKKPHVQWKCFIQQNLWKTHRGVNNFEKQSAKYYDQNS